MSEGAKVRQSNTLSLTHTHIYALYMDGRGELTHTHICGKLAWLDFGLACLALLLSAFATLGQLHPA